MSPTTISAADAASGVDVTITYTPTAAGETAATLTLSSAGAETVTVPITGVAQPRVPTIIVSPESLEFSSLLSSSVTKTIDVTGLFLNGDVAVTLTDPSGVFSVSPTSIPKNSISQNTPVQVSVIFTAGAVEAEYTGSIAFSTQGGQTKTVALSAIARDGGTASDAYLNIAKYATIDEAGASVSGMSSIYKYAEQDGAGWLTVSNYGALQADNNQAWLETSGLSQYGNTWTATDVFQGHSAYFTSSTGGYSIYGSGSQSFYVTNCSQAKALVKGSSTAGTLRIYECTLNADGSVTAASTAFDTKTGAEGVIASGALDPSKIYKVQITGGGSYPDLLEMGFKVELNEPMIIANPTDLVITTAPGEAKSATVSVRGKLLPGDIKVALSDADGVFTVAPTTISKADAEAGTELTVNFECEEEGNHNGTITLTSGTLTTTITLTGKCNDGGTASDNYLNIAKYATIDDAGATVSGMTSIYNYAENEADGYGWLTVSTYGAKKADTNQKWLETSSLSEYNNSWTATDIFPVDDAFFGTAQAYGIYGSATQSFYVTNCTQAKALVKDGGSYKATLAIYECTLNADGTITAATTATDTKQGGASGLVVITSATLDASKIYKIVLKGAGSYPDLLAVGFQTPLPQVDPGITLAEILAEGVNGTEYTVANDLAVVDVADYVNNAFLTDGEGNWIILTADDEIFNSVLDMNVIKGGTLKATLSGIELNPVLTATAAPQAGDATIDYEIQKFNLADTFNPKVNQVIDVLGYWRASEGTMRAFSSGGQSLTLNTSWAASSNTLVDGKRYTIRCAINIKEAWKVSAGLMPKDYDYDFQNYLGYALRLPDTPTAITTIGADGNEIVNVYNVQGMLLKQNIKAADALKELPRGIYIIGNRKVIVR